MRRTLTGLTTLALAASLLAAGPGDEVADTSITSLDAVVDGTTIAIDGVVDYGGQATVVLGTDPTGDAPPAAEADAGRFGLDLTGLSAHVADGDAGVVTLVWHATDLSQLPPPETVRYYWTVEAQEKGAMWPSGQWAFQAKTTDFASAANLGDQSPEQITGNLADYANSTIPSFRIRGNCATDVISNCGHVAWVQGEFDLDANEIRFHLPLDLDNAAPLRPGNTLLPSGDGAWVSIQAVADTVQTRDSVTQTESYVIPERTAVARLLDADGSVVAEGALGVADGEGTSTIGGELAAPGAGTYTLHVVACFADNCAVSTSEVVVG